MEKNKLIFTLILLFAFTSAQLTNDEKKSRVLSCMFLVRLMIEKGELTDQLIQTKALVNCYIKITNPQISEITTILQKKEGIESLGEGIKNLVTGKSVQELSEDTIEAYSNEINRAIQSIQGGQPNLSNPEIFTNLGIIGAILNFFIRISQVITSFFISSLGFNLFIILLYFFLRSFAQIYRECIKN